MLRALVRWKVHLGAVVEAVARAAPGARAYLTGGAAEGRLTALSDVDVVVVLPREPTFEEAVELRAKIHEEMDKLGVPLNLPVELHIVGPESAKRYRVLIPLARPGEGLRC
ncbi:MAG: nucleotidyltransferase domain-containing protein [Thermofilum sp.]